jgi:hypothetical protein
VFGCRLMQLQKDEVGIAVDVRAVERRSLLSYWTSDAYRSSQLARVHPDGVDHPSGGRDIVGS